MQVIPPPSVETVWGVLSGSERRGHWTVPSELKAVAFWGSVHLDLRDAVLSSPTATVHAVPIMGGVEITLPRGLHVEVTGFVLMGGIDDRRRSERPAGGGPLVRIHCSGLWGGVTIRTKGRKAAAGSSAQPPPPSRSSGHLPQHRTTVAILVTDIVSSTRWADQLGDQRWLEVLEDHNALVRDALGHSGGTEVKQNGDGFLATFPSAAAAVEAGLTIQEQIGRRGDGEQAAPHLAVRVAVHAGEVARAQNDVFGVNVSTTDKLCSAASPGEVLVSGVVADLAASSSVIEFGSPRQLTVPGRSEPFRVHTAARR